jgi:hypothetical protein
MTTSLHDVIHSALVAALQKHGSSMYGTVAHFDPVAKTTLLTGIYELRHVSEDITRAVQAKLPAVAAAVSEADAVVIEESLA